MATTKKKIETVDEYIAGFPKDVQSVLRSVQKAIRMAVPGAEELISYQLPAFRLDGWIFYYSAYADHYSLSCPPPFTVFEVFKKELAPYEVTKTAIRFPLDKPVPVQLIQNMAVYRAKENAKKAKGKK